MARNPQHVSDGDCPRLTVQGHQHPLSFTAHSASGHKPGVLWLQLCGLDSPELGHPLLGCVACAGGSVSIPEGEVLVRLFEGAVGPTRLAQASATARLDSQQRLAFQCHLEPAQARHTGHVKLSGSLPLLFTTHSPHKVLFPPPPPPSCCPESSLLLLPAHTIPSPPPPPPPFSLLLLLPLPFHKTLALFLNPTMSILHPCLSYSSSPSIPHAASTPWSQSHLQALALTQQNLWGQWNVGCPVGGPRLELNPHLVSLTLSRSIKRPETTCRFCATSWPPKGIRNG